MNTENCKTNESKKFIINLLANLILKAQIKKLHWLV